MLGSCAFDLTWSIPELTLVQQSLWPILCFRLELCSRTDDRTDCSASPLSKYGYEVDSW
jgi:hypothetical protein